MRGFPFFVFCFTVVFSSAGAKRCIPLVSSVLLAVLTSSRKKPLVSILVLYLVCIWEVFLRDRRILN
jgi:hypothetical protein